MAINAVRSWPDGSPSSEKWTWTSLLSADATGTEIKRAEFMDVNWQVVMNAAGSPAATLTLQGSNDGTNWFTLSNAAGGTALTFTASGGAASLERPIFLRPKLTTAGTSADYTVIVHLSRSAK